MNFLAKQPCAKRLQELISATPLVGKKNEPNSAKENNNLEEKIGSVLSYEEEFMQANPMVGMENVTPYDFMLND